MATTHFCGGQARTLGVSEMRGADGSLIRAANARQCPVCFTVCVEWTPAQILEQKAAYEAKGGVWGANPTGGEKP